MYLTKIIGKYGNLEMIAEDIDREANKMNEEGYELVTYQITKNNENILMTFKKKEN